MDIDFIIFFGVCLCIYVFAKYFIFTYVCMWVRTLEGRCLQRPELLDLHGVQVTDSCELLDVGAWN